MTEPEQWAVELWRKALASYYGPTCVIPERAALTIQRAFEERERKLREAAIAQPSGDEVEAVAELQLAAFLAGRGSVVSMKQGTRTAKPAPTMDEFRRMARNALEAHRGKSARKFNLGDRVTKTKGSSWTGLVVGFYSTSLTPIGYAVESENEPGSVQIYPESALAACLKDRENSDG